MIPNPIPPLPLTPSHHRQLLIAAVCFSSLCSYYTLDVMSTPVNLKGKQPTRHPGKPCNTWNHVVALRLLQYLIKMHLKIGDASTFHIMVCEAATAHITQEFPTRPKIATNVEYKWHKAVCKELVPIEEHRTLLTGLMKMTSGWMIPPVPPTPHPFPTSTSQKMSWNLTSSVQSFKSPALHKMTSTSSQDQHGVTPTLSLGHCTGMDHQLVVSSSIHASKQGCMSGSSIRISQVAVVMNMVGAVNWMGNIVGNALRPPSAEPPSTDYLVMEYQNLVNDTALTMPIRSFMGLLFLNKTQEDICKIIAQSLFDQRAQHSVSSLSDTSFSGPPEISHSAAIPPLSLIAGLMWILVLQGGDLMDHDNF
ncbi:hypothetical protein J3A83DRAFT_4186264 [Scleroderma citrinum]